MSAEDAGNAFLMQEVDAAVTWEPWLTQGKEAAHGHLLADTSEQPGLVADCLVAKPSVFETAWRSSGRWRAPGMRLCDYVEAHPDEANEIMARNVGGWLEDPAVFAETLKGVRLLRRREKSRILRHAGRTRARSTRPRNTASTSGRASARSTCR